MQDLYEKIQNLSPQIVFKKYNHELVREKPSHCLSRAKSKNFPWLHYRRLRIATNQPHIFHRHTNTIPLPKEWVHFPTNSSLKIQARTHEKETIALPERGKLEELAMAPLPAPQKGNRNCNMLIFEKNKITEYVHLSECFMGQSIAFIYLQCNASIVRGLQEATEHFRPNTTLTPLRSEQSAKQNTPEQ